jgi:hypothetical protein
VAYTPDWEKLAEALKRVMAVGVSENQAKLDLCRAVADRKIRVRVRIATSDYAKPAQVFSGANVRVPEHLGSGDFDWVHSYPLSPWLIGPRWGERREPEWVRGWEYRQLDMIELSTADVINVLCSGDISGGNTTAVSPMTSKEETAAISALAMHLKHNPHLIKQDAANWCREHGHNVSDRGFKERVWPNARTSAGLPTKARAGR